MTSRPAMPELLAWFGLERSPFAKLGRPDEVWSSLGLHVVEGLLRYAVAHREIVAVLGDYGSGKTTALHVAAAGLGDDVRLLQVHAAKEHLTIRGLVETCLVELGHQGLPRTDPARRRLLNSAWLAEYRTGRTPLLLLDEAHRLHPSTFSALKHLHEQSRHAHLEALFAVALASHTALSALLSWHAPDLHGRLETHHTAYMPGLVAPQARDYLRHRCRAAGRPDLIADDVLDRIGGMATPLHLNRLGTELLEAAWRAGEPSVTLAAVRHHLPARRMDVPAGTLNLDDLLQEATDGRHCKETAGGA